MAGKGVQLSRSSYSARGAMLARASHAGAQVGDLCFYGRGTHSHVAMYLGGGDVITFGGNLQGKTFGYPSIQKVNYRSDLDEVRSYPAFFA